MHGVNDVDAQRAQSGEKIAIRQRSEASWSTRIFMAGQNATVALKMRAKRH
jgi:hypothetical protein